MILTPNNDNVIDNTLTFRIVFMSKKYKYMQTTKRKTNRSQVAYDNVLREKLRLESVQYSDDFI